MDDYFIIPKNTLSSPYTCLHKREQKDRIKTFAKFPDHISTDYGYIYIYIYIWGQFITLIKHSASEWVKCNLFSLELCLWVQVLELFAALFSWIWNGYSFVVKFPRFKQAVMIFREPRCQGVVKTCQLRGSECALRKLMQLSHAYMTLLQYALTTWFS